MVVAVEVVAVEAVAVAVEGLGSSGPSGRSGLPAVGVSVAWVAAAGWDRLVFEAWEVYQ